MWRRWASGALAPGKDVLAVELGLEKRVPDKYRLHAHHWLILHGRYTCVARKPLCPTCVVRDLCNFPDKTHLMAARPDANRSTLRGAALREARPEKPRLKTASRKTAKR